MIEEDNKTIWCGNISEQVSEELLYELFLQAGPLEKVRIAKDRDGRQKNFAFITYCHEVSVPYALKLFRGTALFHKTLLLQSRGRNILLPPPIRSIGADLSLVDFNPKPALAQQFADMSKRISEDNRCSVTAPRQFHDMKEMVMASLQGNWTHRHHPYRPQDMPHNRDDHRSRDRDDHRARERDLRDNIKSKNNYNKHSSNWRDRRYNKKGNNSYH